MEKLFLLLSFFVCALFLSSCDQDERLNDEWNSKEVCSLSARTRSLDVETEPVKMLYILSGQASEKYSLKSDSAEIDFTLSWPEGFTIDNLKLTISHNIHCDYPYEIVDFNIVNSALTNYKAVVEFYGKLINKAKRDTSLFMYEFSKPVESEEREVKNYYK